MFGVARRHAGGACIEARTAEGGRSKGRLKSTTRCASGARGRFANHFPRPARRVGMPDLTLDLRYLRYALVAAELGSFRRTGEALGVHQSTVSRRVRILEDRLGATLFVRTHSGVRLTASGEGFLREAAIAADHFSRAAQAISSSGRETRGELRVGLYTSLAAGYLGRLLEQFRTRYPDVDVQFEEARSQAILVGVANGRLDVAFVAGKPVVMGCTTLRLWTERVYLALPQNHGLAASDAIRWQEVREDRFIVSTVGPGPEIHDYLIKRLSGVGFRPDIRAHRVGRDNLINMVGKGFGLTVTTEATLGTRFPGVVLRPIDGEDETIPFSAVWNPRNPNAVLTRLLNFARLASSQTEQL